MKKFFLKTMMLAAACLLGLGQSWAQETTTLYERGNETSWTDADITSWTGSTPTVETSGLQLTFGNAGGAATYTISPTANSIIDLDVTFFLKGSTGANAVDQNAAFFRFGNIYILNDAQYCTSRYLLNGHFHEDGYTSTLFHSTSANSSSIYRTTGITYRMVLQINTATNTLTSMNVYVNNSAEASLSITDEILVNTDYTSVSFGYIKNRTSNSSIERIEKILIEETPQAVSTADYTIKFVDEEGKAIDGKDDVVANGVIGSDVVVAAYKPNFWVDTQKYIYVSDDHEGKTIAADGSTVVKMTFRKAGNFGYTFSSNVGTWSATGTAVEGETAKAYVPRYIVVGTTAYLLGGIDKTKNNIEYSKSATIESDGQEITVNYNEFANNVVYFNEGEDIYSTEYADAATRTSMGTAGAIENETVVTTLAPGKYKLYCASHCASKDGATVTYLVGGNTILTQTPAGWLALDYEGTEFTVNTSSDLIITQEGKAAGLDYVLIEKTGDVVAVTDLGWASYCSPYNLTIPADVEAYYASKVGSESVTLTALKEGDVVPAGFGMLIKATEGNYTFNIAATPTVSVDNLLSGTLVETATADLKEADTDKIYVLGNVDGAKLCNFTGDNVPANKAYLRVAKAVNSAPMRFVFEDEATGISQTMTEVKMSNGQCYNLQGQKVAADYKGIVIMNGKKVVMK